VGTVAPHAVFVLITKVKRLHGVVLVIILAVNKSNSSVNKNNSSVNKINSSANKSNSSVNKSNSSVNKSKSFVQVCDRMTSHSLGFV
jgi:hypothetical protein